MSMVTMSGSQIDAHTTYTVIVQARDVAGDDLSAGGDLFYIDIRDKCTWDSVFVWSEPPDSTNNVVSSNSRVKMTDVGDGTYFHKYSVQVSGDITVAVHLYTQNSPILVDYYPWLNALCKTVYSPCRHKRAYRKYRHYFILLESWRWHICEKKIYLRS